MFERRQQIRTQAPLLFTDSIQIPAFQEQRKKPLGEIFGFLGADALPPHETVNRSPIRAAKFFERRLCCWRWALRFQDHAPMSCGKSNRTVLRAWADLIPRGLILVKRHIATQARSHAKSKPA